MSCIALNGDKQCRNLLIVMTCLQMKMLDYPDEQAKDTKLVAYKNS